MVARAARGANRKGPAAEHSSFRRKRGAAVAVALARGAGARCFSAHFGARTLSLRAQPSPTPMIDLLREENALWREHVTAAEQEFLQRVEDFVARDVAPHAEAWERAEELPREIFSAAGAIGLMGVAVPRARGGQGHGYVAYALAIRELARQLLEEAHQTCPYSKAVSGNIDVELRLV